MVAMVSCVGDGLVGVPLGAGLHLDGGKPDLGSVSRSVRGIPSPCSWRRVYEGHSWGNYRIVNVWDPTCSVPGASFFHPLKIPGSIPANLFCVSATFTRGTYPVTGLHIAPSRSSSFFLRVPHETAANQRGHMDTTDSVRPAVSSLMLSEPSVMVNSGLRSSSKMLFFQLDTRCPTHLPIR